MADETTEQPQTLHPIDRVDKAVRRIPAHRHGKGFYTPIELVCCDTDSGVEYGFAPVETDCLCVSFSEEELKRIYSILKERYEP